MPVNKFTNNKPSATDEGSYDFVDSPLSERHLVPSGTSQTSRINVKKGPNGQDYEYEYIYYYYDDENPTSGDNNGMVKNLNFTLNFLDICPVLSTASKQFNRLLFSMFTSPPAAVR